VVRRSASARKPAFIVDFEKRTMELRVSATAKRPKNAYMTTENFSGNTFRRTAKRYGDM
jgi:hypothetical protein